jgi:hypothetical protein
MHKVITGFILLLLSFTALAQPANMASLLACKDIKNDHDRLACFDRLANSLANTQGKIEQLKSPSIVQKMPAKIAPVAQPNVVEQQEEFGLPAKTPAQEIERIQSVVAKISKTPFDKLIVTLDSGAVWQQSSGRAIKLKKGEHIYIERGTIGSFFLGKEGLNGRMKVKRIR